MTEPVSPASPDLDEAHPLSAFAQIHRQMAEAHIATQRALADSHAAYLRASEIALRLAAGQLPPSMTANEEPAPAETWASNAAGADAAPAPRATTTGAPEIDTPPPHEAQDPFATVHDEIPAAPPAWAADDAAPVIAEPIANEPLWYEPPAPAQELAEVLPTTYEPEPVIDAPLDHQEEPAPPPPAESLADIALPASWPTPPAAEEPPEAAPAPRPPALRRLALVAHEEAAPGTAMPGLRAGSRVLLTGGPEPVRTAIGQALTAAGLELSTTPAYLDALISLHGLTDNGGPRAGVEAALAAFAAAHAVAMHPPAVFIAVQNGGGDFGLSGQTPSRAWTAGFAAFTRTVAREWPECATKTIDISEPDPDRLAMRLTRELVFGGAEDMVGLTEDNRRLVPREAELHPAIGAPINIPDDAVIIVSGGARGVTAACLAALCQGRRLRLCLLGRTAYDPTPAADDPGESNNALRERLLSEAAAAGRSLSPAELLTALGDIRAQREVRETIAHLAEAGADIRYVAIDINDAAAVAGAVERTRNEFGRIDGVIHAAGIIADRRIADKTESQFARVVTTKVEGLANLLAATAEDPLSLLVMFGALAGRYGNLGQADYALANATLAAVARAEAARRGGTCLVKSIAWGPWDGGMLDASLKSSFARHDVAVIAQAAGALAFLAELAQPAGDVVATDIVLAPAVEDAATYSDAAQ
jgi:NADP-dependent 3-hydroxy acid dehydrogenase YdfG